MDTGLGVILKYLIIYSLYIGVIVIFCLSCAGKIKYAVTYLIFLFPLQNIFEQLQQLPFGKDIPNLLLISMLIGWLINTSNKGKRFFKKTPLNLLLILYCVYTYFTLWHGSLYFNLPAPVDILDPRLQEWKNYIVFPLLFLIVLNNTKDKKEIIKYFICICAAMLLMNRSTLMEINDASSWVSRNKFQGTFQWLGANEVAAFYATYTFALIGVFIYNRNYRIKLLLGILILMNLYCDLFLFSRGAYLATLAAFAFIGIFKYRFLLIFVVVLLLTWQSVLPLQVVERIKFTEQEGQLDESAEKRIEFWKETMGYFMQSPVIGVGFNVKKFIGSERDTHNLYIRTLAEQGIIGLFFLLAVWFSALKSGIILFIRSKDRFFKGLGLGFSACVIAVMVGNFFGDRWTYLPLGAFFWILWAIVEKGISLSLFETKLSVVSRHNQKVAPSIKHKKIWQIK